MDRVTNLTARRGKMAVVGLGYVGLPLAVAFAKHADVIAYDIDRRLIESYQNGVDPTREVGDEALNASDLTFTDDARALGEADFIIVAVPTPVHDDRSPMLDALEDASRTIGKYLRRGAIVCYESTVYPGVTDERCRPLLERHSGLTAGIDFFIGYSPERINPGDRVNTVETVVKIVAAEDEGTLAELCALYELICRAGVHPMRSIRAAEAAKVAENTQRDVNIAFMNELAVLMNALEIDMGEVIDAMNTKWNALGFLPGLVGGHCIGVDPYYLIHHADTIGLPLNLIRVAREINDAMPAYIVHDIMHNFLARGRSLRGARIAVLGTTFKENCPDIRNSKAAEVVRMLEGLGAEVRVVDPVADPTAVAYTFGFALHNFEDIAGSDAVVVAVAHAEYRTLDLQRLHALCPGSLLVDVKGIIDRHQAGLMGFSYWRL